MREVITLDGNGNAGEFLKSIEASVSGLANRAAFLQNAYAVAFDVVGKAAQGAMSVLQAGVGFNSMIENTKAGMAAIIASNQKLVDSQGQVVTGSRAIEFAMGQATQVQAKLRQDALLTSFTYKELVETFNSGLGPAMAAGVTNLDSVRKVSVAAAQAMQALGIPAHQAAQELRSLFTGDVGPDSRLNQQLRITKADLEKVRSAGGDVGEFVFGKLKTYADAAAASAGNLTVMMSNLVDLFQGMSGEATKPLFDVIKNLVGGAGGSLSGLQSGMNSIGESAAGALRDLYPLVEAVGKLALSLVKAGVEFVRMLGPAAPLLASAIAGTAALIDKYGALIAVLWAAQKVFVILTAAATLSGVAGAVSTVTGAYGALRTSIIATQAALATLPGLFAASGAAGVASATVAALAWSLLGAAIVGVGIGLGFAIKYALDWRQELKNVEAASVTTKEASANLLSGLEKQFPQVKDEAAKLRKELELATTPADINRTNAAILDLKKSVQDLRNTATGPFIAPAVLKEREDEAKAIAKLQSSLNVLNASEGTKAIVAIREKWTLEIAELAKKWGQGSEAVVLATKNMAGEIAKAEKSIGESLRKTRGEAEAFFFSQNVTQDQSGAQARLAAFTKELEDRAVAQSKADKALVDSSREYMRESARVAVEYLKYVTQTVQGMRELAAKNLAEVLNNPNATAGQGVSAALLDVFAKIPTAAESAANAVRDVWSGMARAFDELFFDVLTGRFDDLKDVLKGFSDSIMRSVSNYLSDLLQRYVKTLMTAQQQSGLPMSKSYGPDGTAFGGAASGASSFNLGTGIAAAGVGYGVGSAVGQIGNGQYNMIGAQIGAVAGAIAAAALGIKIGGTIGSAIPGAGTLIGALVGAIVGLVVGALMSPNTEMRVPFAGDKLTKDQRNLTRGVAGDIGGFISDLARTGGFDSTQRGALAGAANDIMTWFFKNMNFSAYAGSREDLDKDIARLFSEVIPRELLHQMFGNRATNDFGNPGYAGITGATRYTDAVDAGAPITKMLLDLGVSFAKIRDISRMIDTQDPKKFMEFLSGFVEVVSGFQDLKKKFSMTAGGLMGEINSDARKTVLDSIKSRVGDIQEVLNAISLYSESQQVEKGKEALKIAREFFDQVKAYAQQLMRAGEEFASSVGSQLQRMRDMFKNREWIADDLRRGITEIMFGSYETGSGSMIGVSPEKGIELAKQAQAYIQQLFDLLAQRLADITALASDIDSLRAKFGLSAGERNFEAAGGNQSLGVAGLANMAAALQAKIRESQTLTGDAQLAKIAEIRDAAGEMYDYHLSLLKSIQDGIREITASIDEQIRGIHWDAVTESYQDALKRMREADNPADAARYKAEAERIRAGQVDELQAQYQALMAQIRGSQDPEEIRRLTAQAQGIMRTYLGLFDGEEVDPATRAAARAAAEAQLRALQELSTSALEALGETINDLIDGGLAGLNDVAGELATQMASVKAEMERLAAQLLLLNQRVQEFVTQGVTNATTEMNKLVPAVIAATSTFTEFSGEVAGGTTGLGDFGDATDVATGKVDRFGRSLDRVAGVLDGLFTGNGSGGATTSGLRGGGGGAPSQIGSALLALRRTPSRSYT